MQDLLLAEEEEKMQQVQFYWMSQLLFNFTFLNTEEDLGLVRIYFWTMHHWQIFCVLLAISYIIRLLFRSTSLPYPSIFCVNFHLCNSCLWKTACPCLFHAGWSLRWQATSGHLSHILLCNSGMPDNPFSWHNATTIQQPREIGFEHIVFENCTWQWHGRLKLS